MKFHPGLLLLVCCTLPLGCATKNPPATVPSVDLARYAGTWHEIARIPNWFQRKCHGPATATYTPLQDGSIRVVNTCLDKEGSEIRVQGKAKVVPGSGGAKLKVSFFPPFQGDYWVLALDEKDYQWVVVGHPSRKYLWFLSRSTEVPQAVFDKMLSAAEKAGYDLDSLNL